VLDDADAEEMNFLREEINNRVTHGKKSGHKI
jgi:hypothetical protein